MRHSSLFVEDDGGITDLNDDVIQEFVALLPKVSCFRLNIRTKHTHGALKVLGEGCASLKHSSVEGKSFQLRLLESNGPVLFSQLECLELNPAKEGIPAAMAVEILHHHAPRTKSLRIGTRSRSI